MNRPATLPAVHSPVAPLVRALRARAPRLRTLLIALLTLALLMLMAALIAVYTPAAHPRDLEVKGASGPKAAAITEALETAARGQSTFAVSEKALLQAVADYPEVAGLQIDAHPPLRLDVTVQMRLPVAVVGAGGSVVTIASDGVVLDRGTERKLPKLDASLGDISIRDGRVRGDTDGLKVLEAAPAPLLALASTIRRGRTGIEIELARGPRLIFGTAEHPRDKWAAAAAVLAEGSAAAAFYIDLRVPSRPAVGGLGGSRTAGALEPPVLSAAAGAAAPASEAAAQPDHPASGETPSTGAVAAPAEAPTAPATAPPATQAQAQSGGPSAPASGGSAGGTAVSGGVSLAP